MGHKRPSEQSLFDGHGVARCLETLMNAWAHQVALTGRTGPGQAALEASNLQMYAVQQRQAPQPRNRAQNAWL